jgi:hypothetical protein
MAIGPIRRVQACPRSLRPLRPAAAELATAWSSALEMRERVGSLYVWPKRGDTFTTSRKIYKACAGAATVSKAQARPRAMSRMCHQPRWVNC